MKKKEVVDLILDMLGGILSGTDFQVKRKDDALVRKIDGGRQMLGVPIRDYNPNFVFSLNICIRLDGVEEIFHRFSGSPPKYRSMSYSLMTRLEHFTGERAEFNVKTAHDIATAGDALSAVIQNKILPFFDENKGLKSLERTVNRTYPRVDITLNPSGAMHAIILAHLSGNSEYDQLVRKFRDDMQLSAEAIHPFNALVEYLSSRG